MGRGADKLRSAARRLKLAGAPPLAPPEPARRARTEAVLTGGCVRLSAQGCCPTPRRLALVSKPIVRRAALGRLARGALTASASPTRSRAGWSRCRRATSSSCSGSDDSAAEARPHRRHAPRLPFAHQPVAPVAAALAPRAPRGSRSSAGRARSQALLLPLHLHDFSLVASAPVWCSCQWCSCRSRRRLTPSSCAATATGGSRWGGHFGGVPEWSMRVLRLTRAPLRDFPGV